MKKESLYMLFAECFVITSDMQNRIIEIADDLKGFGIKHEDMDILIDARKSTVEYVTIINSNYKKLSDLLVRINFNCNNRTQKSMSKYLDLISSVNKTIQNIYCSIYFIGVKRAGIKNAEREDSRYVEVDTELMLDVKYGFDNLNSSIIEYVRKG